jgi:hypothetical protein
MKERRELRHGGQNSEKAKSAPLTSLSQEEKAGNL